MRSGTEVMALRTACVAAAWLCLELVASTSTASMISAYDLPPRNHQVDDGRFQRRHAWVERGILRDRAGENAAFNPSMSPLKRPPGDFGGKSYAEDIIEAVLVEATSSKASQSAATARSQRKHHLGPTPHIPRTYAPQTERSITMPNFSNSSRSGGDGLARVSNPICLNY